MSDEKVDADAEKLHRVLNNALADTFGDEGCEAGALFKVLTYELVAVAVEVNMSAEDWSEFMGDAYNAMQAKPRHLHAVPNE